MLYGLCTTAGLLPAIALISLILAAINGKLDVAPRGALNLWDILQLLILHHVNGATRPNVRFSLRCLPIE